VPHLVQGLAPDCLPLFLTDGFREYLAALVTHYGHWGQSERPQAKGPMPKPRWLPRAGLLYAQVLKTGCRRRLVRVHYRVLCRTLAAVHARLAKHGWQIHTSFIGECHTSNAMREVS
jgi:hypothetical protein